MRYARVLLAAAFVAASVVPVAAEMPETKIPGESPAGAPLPPSPTANPGHPTPKPQTDKLHPSQSNLPTPEPVAPNARPGGAPNLPGSGRQEPVPGA